MSNLIGVVGVNIMKLGVKSAVDNYVTWVVSKNMCKLLSIMWLVGLWVLPGISQI